VKRDQETVAEAHVPPASLSVISPQPGPAGDASHRATIRATTIVEAILDPAGHRFVGTARAYQCDICAFRAACLWTSKGKFCG
jgi:hypothetical protein